MALLRYILLCFLFIDIIARITFKLSPDLTAGNSWWRRNWVEQQKRKQTDLAEYDVTKGWMFRKNLRDVPIFFGKKLNTNSVGGRGLKEFPVELQKGKTRVLVIGDSFTFGSDVNDDETYPYFLEKLNPHLEVFNFGVPGYGHDQMYILLKEKIALYHPAIVVLGFLELDMERSMLSFRDYAKPYFKVAKEDLVLESPYVPSPETVMRTSWMKEGFFDLMSSLLWRMELNGDYYKLLMHTKTEFLLREIKKTTESAGAKPVFFYLPIGKELYDEQDTSGERFLFETCRKYQVFCGSARPAMHVALKRGERLGASTDGRAHYSPEGQRVVAESLVSLLRAH